MQKVYCYADETGQDTEGEFFLVSVVISEKQDKDSIEKKLIEIEEKIGKRKSKWRSTPLKRKITYLERVLEVNRLKGSIFYGVYKNTKDYVILTGRAVSFAIKMKVKEDYRATILIDGLKPKEQRRILKELKNQKVKYRKVKGARHRSSPFIRLADAMAGFIRDYQEGNGYAKKIFDKFYKNNFIKKIE